MNRKYPFENQYVSLGGFMLIIGLLYIFNVLFLRLNFEMIFKITSTYD